MCKFKYIQCVHVENYLLKIAAASLNSNGREIKLHGRSCNKKSEKLKINLQ